MKENGEIKGVIGEKGNKVKIKSLRKNYAKVIFLNLKEVVYYGN